MSRKTTKYTTLEACLLDCILESELSYLRLEQETGVLRQTLMRFAKGNGSLRLDMADQLTKYFEIEIVRKDK